MTASGFPFLTVPIVLQLGVAGLREGATLFPQAAFIFDAVALLLPHVGDIPGVTAGVQPLLDHINALTGATNPG